MIRRYATLTKVTRPAFSPSAVSQSPVSLSPSQDCYGFAAGLKLDALSSAARLCLSSTLHAHCHRLVSLAPAPQPGRNPPRPAHPSPPRSTLPRPHAACAAQSCAPPRPSPPIVLRPSAPRWGPGAAHRGGPRRPVGRVVQNVLPRRGDAVAHDHSRRPVRRGGGGGRGERPDEVHLALRPRRGAHATTMKICSVVRSRESPACSTLT